MGGMVLETNMNEILLRIQEQDKIEKNEVYLIYKNIKLFIVYILPPPFFYLL